VCSSVDMTLIGECIYINIYRCVIDEYVCGSSC